MLVESSSVQTSLKIALERDSRRQLVSQMWWQLVPDEPGHEQHWTTHRQHVLAF